MTSADMNTQPSTEVIITPQWPRVNGIQQNVHVNLMKAFVTMGAWISYVQVFHHSDHDPIHNNPVRLSLTGYETVKTAELFKFCNALMTMNLKTSAKV